MAGPQFQYDVFLSHASADKAAVRELAQRLKRDGLWVWWDEWVIQPGDSIPLAIEQGLESSRTLVLVMSKAAFASEWVTLERHTALFRDPTNKQRRFIPLRLDDCDIKDSLKLFAYVDWRERDEQQYQRLLAVCSASEPVWKSHVARSTVVESGDKRFPYEYGSDLHWLWGWGYRLRSMLNDDHEPSEYDWMIFRPDELARDAMMRFSIEYSHIVKQIDDYLEFTEKQFQAFLDKNDVATRSDFVDAMDALCSRIETASPLISANLNDI